MKKWKIILPLGLAVGAAAALLLRQKPEEKQAAAKKPSAPPKNVKEGSYSFISGFKDPVTVDMTISYDPEKFTYNVISEEFLSYSSDSHVAVLWGEEYHVQLEYAAYYQGEGFEGLSKSAAEKFKGYAPVKYGENEGIRHLDGDSFCFCLKIPGDSQSYLLVTVIRADADPDDFAALPDDSAFGAMLASIRYQLHQ